MSVKDILEKIEYELDKLENECVAMDGHFDSSIRYGKIQILKKILSEIRGEINV